jgi:drug/metabolite transporter (DMT)-like permease
MVPNVNAVIFMLCSTFCLSLGGLFSKVLTVEMSGELLTFLRLFIPAIILLSVVAVSHMPKLAKEVRFAVSIRSLCIVGCQFCFIEALQTLSLVESVVLFATGPLFIPLLEKFIFSVTIRTKTKMGLVLTFFGVMLMAGINQNIEIKSDYLYGLFAGLFNAGSQVSLFRATKHNVTASALNFWTFTLAALGALPILLIHGLSETDTNLIIAPLEHGVIWLLITVFSFTIVGNQLFRSRAYRLVESNSELAPLIYTNILFTVVWQFLFFDVAYSFHQIIGISLIVMASLINTFGFSALKKPSPKLTNE